MSSSPATLHLNNHHRQHPDANPSAPGEPQHRMAVSAFAAGGVASVENRQDGNVFVTFGPESETFEPPRHKDIDVQQVVDLRRMLTNAGYSSPVTELEAEGPQD